MNETLVNNKEIMDKKQLNHRLVRDVIPTVLSLVLTGLYSVVDGLFVGNATGDTGLAAINIAWPITAVITAAGTGIGTGGSILYSYYKGAGEERQSAHYFKKTLVLLLLTGLVLTGVLLPAASPLLKIFGAAGDVYVQGLAYARLIAVGAAFQVLAAGLVPLLRNCGLAPMSMAATICSMVTNCVLNYVFMFICHMGIAGAAAGTIVAQCLAMSISFIALFRNRNFQEHSEAHKVFGKEDIRTTMRNFAKILRTGIAAFGLSIAPSVVLVFTNRQCLNFGGEEVVAAYAVISYIVFPAQNILTGLCDGAQPALSFFYGLAAERAGAAGAGAQTDRRSITGREISYIQKVIRLVITVTGIALFALAFVTAPVVPEIFGMSAQSAAFYEAGIKISGTAFLLIGFVRLNMVVLSAALKVKVAMALVYLEMLVVSPLMIFVLPAMFGVNGIWLSLPMTFVFSLLNFYVYFTRHR